MINHCNDRVLLREFVDTSLHEKDRNFRAICLRDCSELSELHNDWLDLGEVQTSSKSYCRPERQTALLVGVSFSGVCDGGAKKLSFDVTPSEDKHA